MSILEKTKALADEMKTIPEVIAYRECLAKVKADPVASDLIEKYNYYQAKIEAAKQGSREFEDAFRELSVTQYNIDTNPMMKEYYAALDTIGEVINQVGKALVDELDNLD